MGREYDFSAHILSLLTGPGFCANWFIDSGMNEVSQQ